MALKEGPPVSSEVLVFAALSAQTPKVREPLLPQRALPPAETALLFRPVGDREAPNTARQRDKCRPLSPPRAVRPEAIRATSRQPPTTNAVFDALRLKRIHPVSPPNRLSNPLVTRASVERQTLLGFPHPPRHRREASHPRRPFGRKLWRKAFGLRRTMPCKASRSGASARRERLFCGGHQSKCGRGAALLHCRGAVPKVRRRAPLPIAGQNSAR